MMRSGIRVEGGRIESDAKPQPARLLGQNGRERVQENFLMTTNVGRWLLPFRIVLGNGSGDLPIAKRPIPQTRMEFLPRLPHS
jgi:hypothetical protein